MLVFTLCLNSLVSQVSPLITLSPLDEVSFSIVSYSQNTRDMLALLPRSVPSLEKPEILTIGTDVRTLFMPSNSVLLEKAFGAREITLLNLVWIHSKNSGRRFCIG